MTDATQPTDGTPEAEGGKAPEGHHFSQFRGRQVLVKNVSVGQRMVAQGIVKGLESGELTDADVPRLMDKIWTLIGAMLPQAADRDFIEMLTLKGEVDLEDLAPLVLSTPAAPKSPAAKQPRRGK